MGDRNRFSFGRRPDRPASGAVAVAAALDAASVTPIVPAAGRALVSVDSTLETVEQTERGGVPCIEATLRDEEGELTIVWLGRRSIGGIEPGRRVVVTARIGMHGDTRIMYNPRYELKSA